MNLRNAVNIETAILTISKNLAALKNALFDKVIFDMKI